MSQINKFIRINEFIVINKENIRTVRLYPSLFSNKWTISVSSNQMFITNIYGRYANFNEAYEALEKFKKELNQ